VKVAFTYNLKKSGDESEAEFDSPETVAAITQAIERNGHRCLPIDVTGTLPDLIEQLRAAAPDIVFNTAEGVRGRTREALYPAVFDELGIPHTGSDAHALTVTLDKNLTCLVVERAGVRIPRGQFRMAGEAPDGYCPMPCLVKPNFEGSSKGITDASVVTDSTQLNATVAKALRAYPEGVLIEEYVPGVDVVVGYMEGLGPEVLTPCAYEIKPEVASKFRLYDFRLKHETADPMVVACPPRLPQKTISELKAFARKAIKALNLRNCARLDFRVRDDGTVFFVEANGNPTMEPGASLYVMTKEHGLDFDGTIGHVINNAAARWAKVEREAKRLDRARKAWMLPVGT
jgi:D-alanine-D-alanine ligase